MDEKPPVMLKRTRSNGSGDAGGSSAQPGAGAEPAAKSARGAAASGGQPRSHQGAMTYERGGGSGSANARGAGAGPGAAGAGAPPMNLEDIAAATAPSFFASGPKVRPPPEFRTLPGSNGQRPRRRCSSPVISFETAPILAPTRDPDPPLVLDLVHHVADAQRQAVLSPQAAPRPRRSPPPSPPPTRRPPPPPLLYCSRDDRTSTTRWCSRGWPAHIAPLTRDTRISAQ